MNRARRLFSRYLDEYNKARAQRGLPSVGAEWRFAMLMGRKPVESEKSLYIAYMEGLVEDMWPDAERGFKVARAAAIGNRKKYGSLAEKASRWAEHQAEVDRLHRDYPRWNWSRIQGEAGKKLGVTARTIRAHALNPAKKT